jgi:CubicO group peptidase (beta-lactamase class C family)
MEAKMRRYYLIALFVLILLTVPLFADNNIEKSVQKTVFPPNKTADQQKATGDDTSDNQILLNGDCSDYIDLSDRPLPFSVSGTTAGATNDYGPFSSHPACWDGMWYYECGAGPDKTYKWTAPANGRYTISLLGSLYDTSLLLYNFTCPAEPSYPEDFICGNDDYSDIQSELSLEFSAGQEVLIVVDGFGGDAGPYQLRIREHHQISNIDSFLVATMEALCIPGLAACAIRDGIIVWSGNYGYADISQQIEPMDSTLFVLASTSKTFVGVALMQLWEQGLFDLDEDINQFLPWEIHNPFYPDSIITLRMLMSHTSSILTNMDLHYLHITWGYDYPMPLGEYLRNYLTPDGDYYYPEANFGNYIPGTVYNYSNPAIALAGYLVERINPDSLSFEDYCQQHIFAPLGMNNSSFFLANLDINDIAVLYYWDGYNYVSLPQWGWPLFPAGQLRTSTNQLARFLTAFMQHGQIDGTRILDSTTVDLMTTIYSGGFYGLCWYWSQMGGRSLWGHEGAFYGSRTYMHFCPDENTGVIVLTNGQTMSHNVVDELFEFVGQNVAVQAPPSIPKHFSLSQNYPNPFNAQTTIQYSLPEQSLVSIDIFDILGCKIETLAEGIKPTGEYQSIWDASGQASGIYFYRFKAGDRVETKKMVLMK